MQFEDNFLQVLRVSKVQPGRSFLVQRGLRTGGGLAGGESESERNGEGGVVATTHL